MATEGTTNLETLNQEPIETTIETPKTKVFETAEDPETKENKRYRLEDSWKNEPFKPEVWDELSEEEQKARKGGLEMKSYEAPKHEIIEKPLSNNLALVQHINKEGKHNITDDDVLIRKGNTVFIKKKQNDGAFHLSVVNFNNPELQQKVSETDVLGYNPETTTIESDTKKIPTEEKEIPFLKIQGNKIKAEDHLKYAPDIVVEKITEEGDQNFIYLKNKKDNTEYKVSTASLLYINNIGDMQQYLIETPVQEADFDSQSMGLQQIRRGIKEKNPNPIKRGAKNLDKYKTSLKELANADTATAEIETEIASTENKIIKAKEKIGEIKEQKKSQQENLEDLLEKGKKFGVETTAIEQQIKEENKPGLDDLTKKLKTQPEMQKEKYEKTPAQLVAEAREEYLALYKKSFEKKGAFKRGFLNLTHATGLLKKDSEKLLSPEAKIAKQKYEELKNGLQQAMVDRLKAQGKSDEQIISIMKRYRQVATGLEKVEQESEILKGAREEVFAGSKTEKLMKKSLEWYKNLDPIKKRLLGISIGTASGLVTGGVSSAATWLGFLGSYAVRYTAGTGAGWIAGWAGEKFWKSGKGGKYETKLEELKKQYMAGEITPAKYQQTKEGLEMLENKAKTIKGAVTTGAAFGAAAGTTGITSSIASNIEGVADFHQTPVTTHTESTDGFSIDLEKYKVDVPPDQFITEAHAPGEMPIVNHTEAPAPILEKTTGASLEKIDFDKSVGGSVKNKFNIDFNKELQETVMGKENSAASKIDFSSNYDDRVIENQNTTTKSTIDFSSNYDDRLIDNPNVETTDSVKINPTSIFENNDTLLKQKLDVFINTEFKSNTSLWEPLKGINASVFVTQPESNIENAFMDIYKDLGAAAKNVPPTSTETVEGYVQRLITQGVDLNQSK